MTADVRARKARYFLYVLGGLFVALGFALEGVPMLAEVVHPLAGRSCAALGAIILSAGRFGTDRFVRRLEAPFWGRFSG